MNGSPEVHPIWRVQGPEKWAGPPSPMSFSTLRAIETCPLSWALSRSSYPAIRAEPGYPPRIRTKTLLGQVIHEALERIMKKVAASEPGQSEPGTGLVAALKSLGGYSRVLEDAIDKLTPSLTVNPRAVNSGHDVIEELRAQLPDLRIRTQKIIAQGGADLLGAVTKGAAGSTPISGNGHRGKPLGFGTHAEVPLNHPIAGWYGRADLLRLEGDGCEITDFKTGLQKEDHNLQLRAYAWLWYNDQVKNPTRRRATNLRLVYSAGAVPVAAPSVPELDELEDQLRTRGDTARAAITNPSPEARPSKDACSLCDVRQLCPEYWRTDVQTALYAGTPRDARDAEVEILNRQGEWSWRGRIISGGMFAAGTKAVVRARPQDASFTALLETSRRVRLVGIHFSEPSEESGGAAVINLLKSSEVFTLS